MKHKESAREIVAVRIVKMSAWAKCETKLIIALIDVKYIFCAYTHWIYLVTNYGKIVRVDQLTKRKIRDFTLKRCIC